MEYTASEIRKLLQQLFPHRRLVLSQFTFFNQVGVAKPTGDLFRRGRRCYRLSDVLSIACVLALKEEGIPLKNIQQVPRLIQQESERILRVGDGVRLSGFGDNIVLEFPDDRARERNFNPVLAAFLEEESAGRIFWSFDVGVLGRQLEAIARGEIDVRKAA